MLALALLFVYAHAFCLWPTFHLMQPSCMSCFAAFIVVLLSSISLLTLLVQRVLNADANNWVLFLTWADPNCLVFSIEIRQSDSLLPFLVATWSLSSRKRQPLQPFSPGAAVGPLPLTVTKKVVRHWSHNCCSCCDLATSHLVSMSPGLCFQ